MKTVLAIPTYRATDIAQTVSLYGQNFKRHGHDVPIMVFDDSNRSNARISEGSLRIASQRLGSQQQVWYVGPYEKARFKQGLKDRLGPEHDSTVDKIFKPSYGGNRNFVLVYTLGDHFISVDDDIRPMGLFTSSGNTQTTDNSQLISRGRFLFEREVTGIPLIDQDVITGYQKFLGTKVRDHLGRVTMGSDVKDPNVDDLGFTQGSLDEGLMIALPGKVPHDAIIKIAQTHITGDADIDSADLVHLFMETGVREVLSGHLPKKYVAEVCREAITASNNRLNGEILGYDNSDGALYFLPTALRCEDFIWRVHLEHQPKVACAYTKHAQYHERALSVRASVASDWFNELKAQQVKRRIRESVKEVGPYTMTFHTPKPISLETARDIETQIREKRDQARDISTSNGHSAHYLRFAGELDAILQDEIVSPRQFATRLTSIVNSEFNWFNRTAALWPQILEYATEMQGKLPIINITHEASRN